MADTNLVEIAAAVATVVTSSAASYRVAINRHVRKANERMDAMEVAHAESLKKLRTELDEEIEAVRRRAMGSISNEEINGLAQELQALRHAVDSLRKEFDQVEHIARDSASQADLARFVSETSAKMERILERLGEVRGALNTIKK